MLRRNHAALIAALTSTAMFSDMVARAYPSDVFATPGAVPTPQSGKEASPSFQSDRVDATGAASISVPIPTAPNRNGHIPQLSLSYSSKNPVRGGLAMGWELDLPKIELDTAHGRVQETRYRASEGGRLIQVDEATEPGWTAYRGEEDGSFTRYERDDGTTAQRWRARKTDGTVLYFGETAESKDQGNEHSAFDAYEGRWFITRSIDKFGNEIQYNYQKVMGYAPEGGDVAVDIALSSIEYGANQNAALTHHTTIHFDYKSTPDFCDGSVGNVPIGALMDFRTGIMIYRGAARLQRVRLETRGPAGTAERRRLDLQYDENEIQCQQGVAHAPLRILTSVAETAFALDGTATALPAQTFEYNRLERAFDASRSTGTTLGGGRVGKSTVNNAKNRDATDTMLLDLDGDGIVDRLTTGTISSNSECTATWERGTGSGFEAPLTVGETATLLMLPWQNGAAPSGRELCSISHQLSQANNLAEVAPCTGEASQGVSPDSQMKYQFRDWNHDGLADLLMTAESRNDQFRPELDDGLTPDPVCPDPPINGTGGGCGRVEEKACGSFVSRVAYNQGDGTFSAPELLLLPIPMDPQQRANGQTPQALLDLDGDGYEDVVRFAHDSQQSWNQYLVALNQRDGTFTADIPYPLPIVEGYDYDSIGEQDVYGPISLAPSVVRSINVGGSLPVRATDPVGDSTGTIDIELDLGTESTTRGEFRDLNGDGLADYVFSRGNGVRVLYNTGGDFLQELLPAPANRGHLVLDATQPDALERTRRVNALLDIGSDIPGHHWQWYTRNTLRAVDFDGDGLTDLVRLPEPRAAEADNEDTLYDYFPEIEENEPAELFINLGNRYVSVGNSTALERAKHGLSHRIDNELQANNWRVRTDFVDIDGDGLPEAVNGTQARYDADDQPLRLLKAVHNGRGGQTQYHYRVVTGEGVPSPIWVVDSVTSSSSSGAEAADPPMVTSYNYVSPVYGSDPDGDYAFRGFEQFESVLPSGASQVQTSDYSQSYRGLVVREEVFDVDQQLISLTSRAFQQRKLFESDAYPGEVTTYHPVTEQTHTCRAGQGYMQCLQSGDLRTIERSFVALAPIGGGSPARQILQWERSGPALGALPGNKLLWSVPQYTSTADKYLDHPAGALSLAYDAPNVTRQVSATYHYYDSSNRCAFWTTRAIDSTSWAVSTHICDLTTGNKSFEMSPRFFGGSGPGRVYELDADKRFIVKTTNELGHEVLATWDPSTGKQLSERGPNSKTVNGAPVRAGWEVDVDGLGRELRRRVYLDDAVLGYRAEEVSRQSYFDPPNQRSRVVTEKKIDLGGTRWAKTEAESDGLGRAVIERSYEDNAVRAETRRFYDAAGQLARVKAPRPGAYYLELVEWQYGYDSLGRMIEVREPTRAGCDGALGSAGACGKRWEYSGRATTELDAVGTLGGRIAKTRSTLDAFGRLALVEEALDDDTWATTSYQFDGNDNVSTVTNADGVVTVMAHDQLSRRTAVTRGPNTWQFGYDPAGNLTSVRSPVPAGETSANYETTIAYDALNRETLRTPANRNWGVDETTSFGSGVVSSSYDSGPNGIGRLAQVTADWGAPDQYQVGYDYEARGLVTAETHSFSLLEGAYADTRSLSRSYTAQGLPWTFTEADGDLPSTSTKLVTAYDTRGLPKVTHWWGQGWTQQVRRLADGRVFHRYWSHPGVVEAEGNTAFDDAGRVTWLNVKSKLPGQTGATERVAQTYHFDGAGDVTGLDAVFSPDGGTPQAVSAQYQYDAMHRLTGATGDRNYQGSFGYSPGGRIVSAAVSADAEAVRVRNRDVTYVYASEVAGSTADPDAPVEILNVAAPGDFMTIGYDRSGNAVERKIEGTKLAHLYDGLDRQRQAVAPDGSRELYHYGADGMRALVVSMDPDDNVTRVQWNLGNTEIWYDGVGDVEKTVATAAIDGAVVRIVDRNHRELVFQDPRSHAIATIGENGEMLAGFSYGPYGELLREFGSETEDHLRRFNGKQWDATSGLSYYGYRYYDEASLTWTQADPKYRWAPDSTKREPRQASLYAFTLGNPVLMVDPNGLQTRQNDATPKKWWDVWPDAGRKSSILDILNASRPLQNRDDSCETIGCAMANGGSIGATKVSVFINADGPGVKVTEAAVDLGDGGSLLAITLRITAAQASAKAALAKKQLVDNNVGGLAVEFGSLQATLRPDGSLDFDARLFSINGRLGPLEQDIGIGVGPRCVYGVCSSVLRTVIPDIAAGYSKVADDILKRNPGCAKTGIGTCPGQGYFMGKQ